TGSVDHTALGSYTLHYNVSDSSGNAADEKTRTVNVVDTGAPMIALLGDNPMTLDVGTPYAEPGYTATDNHDGDITLSVVVTGSVDHTVLGSYTLHYNVSDSSGNAADEKTRTVSVVDTGAPMIALLGDSPMTLDVGTPYAEPGYTATDNHDGEITANVVVTGSVVHTVLGSYILHYNVSDSSGNAADEKTRRVSVVDNTPPFTSGHLPARGAVDVPIDTDISFHITDAREGVDKSSILLTVNGASVAPAITGTPADYLVSYNPSSDFGYSTSVTVSIDAQDLASPPNMMPRQTYSFTTLAEPDRTPPSTSGHTPAKGAVGVPVHTDISFHITDGGDGVDQSSIVMTVNGSPVVPSITGTPADYLVSYDPPADFAYGGTIVVTIDAQDLHFPPNIMYRERYEFSTAKSDEDPASSDPNVFFFEDFEDGDVNFPNWGNTDNFNEIATGDLAIVEASLPGSSGRKVLHLGATRGLGAGLVKHFAPVDTLYCRWYVRFAPGFDQGNLLQFVALAADSTGEFYRVGDVNPNGYDYFRSSLNLTTDWGRVPPPGKAILYTYYLGMKPTLYDDDGDGFKDVHWPGNVFSSNPSPLIEGDRWYCMEMMIRANTPGLDDGEQAFWVDGQLAGYWAGLPWRLTEALKLNCLWLHIAVPEVSAANQVRIDNVALSTQYIGPIGPPSDRASVVMEDVSVKMVGHSSARIAWMTDKPATSIVLYGEGASYSTTVCDTRLTTNHLVQLRALKSGTDYRCRIISRDATGGNEAVSEGLAFATLASSRGVFKEEWGDAAGTNHPDTVQDTYISVTDFPSDSGKESPASPSQSASLCAYTFPVGKPGSALLMKWDLSAIPRTAEILEAKLRLYMFESGGDPECFLSVHKIVGVDPVVSEATGCYYRTGCAWTPFPGLYNDIPLAQSNIAPQEDLVNVGNVINEYKEWKITKMVSKWVSSSHQNHGLLINPDLTASASSYVYFRSSSYEDVSQRPCLIVTCRISRGQNLIWEEGAFVIETEPWLAEEYIVQSADEPAGPWMNETSVLNNRWWHSGELGPDRMRFFRVQNAP
ncbi:DUF5011 domain-containing protein, partial [bacterium]|nr:DUF5011 domain-containing protein [bacterium]